MTGDQATKFLQCLGAMGIDQSGNWVMACCPLAREVVNVF